MSTYQLQIHIISNDVFKTYNASNKPTIFALSRGAYIYFYVSNKGFLFKKLWNVIVCTHFAISRRVRILTCRKRQLYDRTCSSFKKNSAKPDLFWQQMLKDMCPSQFKEFWTRGYPDDIEYVLHPWLSTTMDCLFDEATTLKPLSEHMRHSKDPSH